MPEPTDAPEPTDTTDASDARGAVTTADGPADRESTDDRLTWGDDEVSSGDDADVDWLDDAEPTYEYVDDDWDDEDDGEYVYVPEDRGVIKKLLVVFACFVLFVFMVAGLGGYWLYSQVNSSPNQAEPVVLVVPKDAGLATISRLLEEKQVISNATIFRYYAKWKNMPPVKAGQYDKLYKSDSMDHVIERLNQGPLPPKTTKFGPVPEGLWKLDTIALMKKAFPEMSDDQAFAQAEANVHSKYQPQGAALDGFLFPAAYQVSDDDKANPQPIFDQMVKQFDQVGDEIGLGDAPTRLAGVAGSKPIGPYEVVIVAALVESEAKVPEDRPRIARVIYNRLKNTPTVPIGIDATVPYALGVHKQELTKADLDVDSPYNLRKYPGLTPTPINSPGKESLIAALNPSVEPGADKWMYYVLADKDGHHFFTGNYQEFLNAQKQAQQQGLI